MAKEDLFSSTEDNLLSAAEKSMSVENLNSQLDDYKTTNAPDSNDKQQLEPAIRSANLSNCDKIPPPQGKKNQPFPSHKVIDQSDMIFNGQSLQYTLGLPILPVQSELAFSMRQGKAPQPSDVEAHLDWGNLLADSKNIPDCLKMCEALQGTDRDSVEFEEYRLLAQMVVNNQ